MTVHIEAALAIATDLASENEPQSIGREGGGCIDVSMPTATV